MVSKLLSRCSFCNLEKFYFMFAIFVFQNATFYRLLLSLVSIWF